MTIKIIKIEKGIRIPERDLAHHGSRKYPFPDMKIGDSILLSRNVTGAISAYRRHNPDFYYTTRKVGDGDSVRLWRIKKPRKQTTKKLIKK